MRKKLLILIVLILAISCCNNVIYAIENTQNSVTSVESTQSPKIEENEKIEIHRNKQFPKLLKYQHYVLDNVYMFYTDDGEECPAYYIHDINTSKDYIAQSIKVIVLDIKQMYQNNLKVLVQGYPYKTVEELGCANEEEAIIATQHALECYSCGLNISDYSVAEDGGESGNRTLQAMKNILKNSESVTEEQVNSALKIRKAMFTAYMSKRNYSFLVTGKAKKEEKVEKIEQVEKEEEKIVETKEEQALSEPVKKLPKTGL